MTGWRLGGPALAHISHHCGRPKENGSPGGQSQGREISEKAVPWPTQRTWRRVESPAATSDTWRVWHPPSPFPAFLF